MKKYSADYIFDAQTGKFLKDRVLIMEGDQVADVLPIEGVGEDIKRFEGILTPGFVNTHCHLELSHLKSQIPSGTGLIHFITKVLQLRKYEESVILSAIREADHRMHDSGIVAVGDISNTTHTILQKSNSPIRYFTFIELFDLMNHQLTSSTIQQYQKVYDLHHGAKSLVPHAPYSVTPKLFSYIQASNDKEVTVSIHNQEVAAENDLFAKGNGDFIDFYRQLNMELDESIRTGQTSIHYAIEHLDPSVRNLFVHNTMTSKEEIKAAQEWSDKVYWATCPNANLYIENRLPNYQSFIDEEAKMTIGTDSLSSNWQLSIWEEIKTIKKYNDYIDLQTLLQWATINGSDALGFSDQLGSFEQGKSPGIVHINYLPENGIAALQESNSQLILPAER